MKRIDGRARTVRELLDGARYTIDFYQREYAWQQRQVYELIDDLTGKFLDSYEPGHERHEVETYSHYFLGSIVISHKRGQRFIVDGQQRLTTLTLLLIQLHHLQDGRDDKVAIKNLIFSEKYGRRSFNLEVPDRAACMEKLYLGEPFSAEDASESVQTIVARYADLADYFPEEVSGEALPYFVDWLLENVHLVEIEAYSDEDAYTIFETMNDRGLSLSLPDMLKGYVLANITHETDQRKVNELWKQHMHSLRELGAEEDVDFFKHWLRARYADTIRPGGKGAENKDVERIGTEFHRWVRDQRARLGLNGGDSFVRFVTRDLDFYARWAVFIRDAATTLTRGLESIRFNAARTFTMQTQVLLAALSPDDKPESIRRKLALVADYLDIWLARRVWNHRTVSQRAVRYAIFLLTKELRDKSIEEMSGMLLDLLAADTETFARTPNFGMHQQNYRQVRHILARLTYWVDRECGLPTHFEDLVSQGRSRPFEIEHLWANHFDRFREWFAHPRDFEIGRNRLGGLILLQRGHNQSLGDLPYEKKRDAYVSSGQSLLARSLHPLAYDNNPAFAKLRQRTGLAFRPYDHFDVEAQSERQELYLRIAEWVWNPSRLALDGEKPPVHEPLVGDSPKKTKAHPDGDTGSSPAQDHRQAMRYRFWTGLLEAVKARGGIHAEVSPSVSNAIGALDPAAKGVRWNFAVLQNETRLAMRLRNADPAVNKARFDALYAQRAEIEAEIGRSLEWERRDEDRVSRISLTLPGGWADESTWPKVHEEAAVAMERLVAVLGPRVKGMD